MSGSSAQPPWRKQSKKAGANRLMALSGAVIVAVYATGYIRTEGPARQAAAAAAAFAQAARAASVSTLSTPTQGNASSSATGGSGSVSPASVSSSTQAVSSSSANPSSTTTAKSSSSSSAASPYKNGSYTATGYGFHGPIGVTVVVSGGKIASANVTYCGTTYSCHYMSPLSAQVVSVQGPPIDYVAGATASSDAYYQAVTQALAKAKQ